MKAQNSCLVIAVLAVVLTLASATIVPHPIPVRDHVPRTYKVSLDDPIEKRWQAMIRDYREPMYKFVQYLDMLHIPKRFFEGVEWYAKNIYKQQDFVAEVDTIAKLSGLPFQKLFFINFMYEFSTFRACTGILVTNSAGEVMHGRNLDFEMWEILSKLLIHVEYYKDGKLLYNSDIMAGSVFALTGSRPGAFAANVDTRFAKHFGQDLISVLIDDAPPTCWLLKKTLQEENTYARAVKRLKAERVGGPVYFIVSGVNPYEGIVIERDVNSVHAFYELSEQNWFIVETNYDRDYPDPAFDPRRVGVEKRLRERGNALFDKDTLMDDFMMMWPTFNIGTIMTAIMIPKQGYHNTTAWYGNNPQGEQSGGLDINFQKED